MGRRRKGKRRAGLDVEGFLLDGVHHPGVLEVGLVLSASKNKRQSGRRRGSRILERERELT